MRATMIMGLPGSGKSTLCQKIPGHIINRDGIRKMIYGKYNYVKEHEPTILEMAFACAMCVAHDGYDIIIDETGVNVVTRIGWIEHLKKLGYKVHGVYVDTPVEICMARRQDDNKGLDQDWSKIILGMEHGFKRPTLAEGYDALDVVAGY